MLKAEPLWITHAREIFAYMWEHSEVNEYDERLYEGNIGSLIGDICGSQAQYSQIVNLLKTHEVIRIVRQGNRWHKTLVELTGELQGDALLPPEHLTSARHGATLVAGIENQVKSLAAWRESLEKGGLDVAKVLQDFELRITKLEREVQSSGKETQAAAKTTAGRSTGSRTSKRSTG